MARIVDCFTFYDELELLEIRLHELQDVVDHFVLVEANQTFSGEPKDYIYRNNRHHFADWNIFPVTIEGFPDELTSAWQREAYSRNSLAVALGDLHLAPNDIVLLSDIDEIPRADLVNKYGTMLAAGLRGASYVFHQNLYYYHVNFQLAQEWQGTRMARYQDVSTLQALRVSGGVPLPGAGWHFSYLGGTERIRSKIAAYSHTELNVSPFTDSKHIAQCLDQGRDLFGRDIQGRIVELDESYPVYLQQNQGRFSHLIRAPSRSELRIADLYAQAMATPSDIQHHLPLLSRLASTVNHVTEFGVRSGNSSIAFLNGKPKSLQCYDLERHDIVSTLERIGKEEEVDYQFNQQDVLMTEITPTDLLFIDTWHVEEQMQQELELHADKARRYLVMHDTETFGEKGETSGHRGIWFAIAGFMQKHPEWRLMSHSEMSNGLTIFVRVESER